MKKLLTFIMLIPLIGISQQETVMAIKLNDGKILYAKSYNSEITSDGVTFTFQGVSGKDYDYLAPPSDQTPSQVYPGTLWNISQNGNGDWIIECKSSTSTCFETFRIQEKDIQNVVAINDPSNPTILYADKIDVVSFGNGSFGFTATGNIKPLNVSQEELNAYLSGGAQIPFVTDVFGILRSVYNFDNGTFLIQCDPGPGICFRYIRKHTATSDPRW